MKKNNEKAIVNDKKKEVSFFVFFLFLLVTSAIFSYYKPKANEYSIFNRTWGFDLISFYSTFSKTVIYGFAILIILPKTNHLLVKLFKIVGDKLKVLRNNKKLLFLLISIVSILVFYLLRVKYIFLGDFNLRLEQVVRGEFVKTEYLTMKMLYYFTKAGSKLGLSPMQMFINYSCVAGGFYIYLSLLISDILGKSNLQKLFFFLSLIASSLLLIFCGYIEIYATPIVFLLLYIYLALKYLENKKYFILVVSSLFIAVAAHLFCLAAIPSLFVLWYFNNKSKLKAISSLTNYKIAVVITILILVSLSIVLINNTSFSLPLSPPQNLPNYLTFFSIAHFWELFNGQLLCCGISFLFVFYLLFKIVKLKIILPPKVYFLITITGCILLLILVANFHRGSADWDIMAFSAVTLNLLTSILLYNVYNNQTNLLNYLQLSIFGLNAITAFLWVHINHTDKSIKKIEKMLLTDPGNYYTRLPSCIELGVLYKINHLEKEVETTLLNACNISQVNDLRPCIMYARNLIELGKVDEGAKFYEDLLLRNQCIPEAYMFLLEYYEKNGNYTNFLDYYHKFFDAFMLQPNYFILKYEPKIYLKLFEYLYKIELPNNNKHKLDEISFAIEKLKTMIPKK